eukprot:EC850220.1.p4 GENE.EC850220.1~~EC850220.1.p4  ORF type:complete len:66 (-),score=0.90 EC850220.1:236-433(-)
MDYYFVPSTRAGSRLMQSATKILVFHPRSAIQESKVASRFSGRVLAIHQCRHLKNQRAGGMRVAD